MIERPVFVVAPPRSGATALFSSLARAVLESGKGTIFDVALLHGVRYPEVAEEASDAATNSFVLPEAQPPG